MSRLENEAVVAAFEAALRGRDVVKFELERDPVQVNADDPLDKSPRWILGDVLVVRIKFAAPLDRGSDEPH